MAHGGGEARRGELKWDGTFRIAHLGAGRWLVQARLDQRVVSAAAVLGSDDEAQVVLRFTPGATVRGIALRQGSPLAASVAIYCPASVFHAATSTDGEGRFALAGVPEEECELSLASPTTGARDRRRLAVGGDTEVRIALVTVPLEGVVRRAGSGEPIAGARVALSRPGEGGGPLVVVATDERGRFVLRELDAGGWMARVESPGSAALERYLEITGPTAVELSLPSPPPDHAGPAGG